MKYYKRLGIYKASNVTFDPKNLTAFSYRWWMFLGIIEGKLVFNSYRYSNTTARHQYKVEMLLRELGIRVDITAPIPNGLGTISTLAELVETAEQHLCDTYLSNVLKKQQRYQRRKDLIQERRVIAKLNQDMVETDDCSPNLVASTAYDLGIKLSSDQVVSISNSYRFVCAKSIGHQTNSLVEE